jgi:hypothetical protein
MQNVTSVIPVLSRSWLKAPIRFVNLVMVPGCCNSLPVKIMATLVVKNSDMY